MDLSLSDLMERSRASTAETEKEAAASGRRSAQSLLISSAAGCFAFPVTSGKHYVVGRALDCDVVIDDPSVSRRHAEIHVGAHTLVEDLGSTNGTSIQGHPVLPGTKARVEHGLAIELGSATVVLHHSPKPNPSASPMLAGAGSPTVVHDPAMQRLYAMLDVIAPTTLSVVLLGETGVGKEVFAEALVRRSTRSDKTFVRLNCAALPESLLEAELFGVEKGAFTGATHAKKGLFESADGGTLFLDEVGDMAFSTQTKLLRALESGEVTRLGSAKPRKVDVRFISASNRDIRQLVSAGTFRSDLFFRLNGIALTLPPLRHRPADVLPLARFFLDEGATAMGRKPPRLSTEVEELLQRHPWPGNVRQLRNVIQRAVVLSRGSRVLPEHLLLHEESRETTLPGEVELSSEQATVRIPVHVAEPAAVPVELRGTMDGFERQHLLAALEKTGGNQTHAAALLGIARRTLIKKMVRHGIERPRVRTGPRSDGDD